MTTAGKSSRVDIVELSIPIQAELLVLARLGASTLAARAGFDLEEIEDLRLAVEELCLSIAVADGGPQRIHLRYRLDNGTIEVRCVLEPDPSGGASELLTDRTGGELSWRILDALVDEHGREEVDGRPAAWLRKRRARSSV